VQFVIAVQGRIGVPGPVAVSNLRFASCIASMCPAVQQRDGDARGQFVHRADDLAASRTSFSTSCVTRV